jgi:hypothetical protein
MEEGSLAIRSLKPHFSSCIPCGHDSEANMHKDVAAQLLEIVEHLERDAKVTAACGLQVTTKLLRMARLDLLCRVHDISDGELQAIGDELASRQPIGDGTILDGGFKLPH